MSERIEIRPKNAQLASYHTVSSDEEESASGSSDDENGRGFSDYAWSCASALVPQTDVAWPASFTTSAAFLLRQAPTIEAYEERDELWVSTLTWGSPMDRYGRRDQEFLPRPGSPHRLRGYSDDAPILKLKLPLHDAKLSDTTWLAKARIDLGMDPPPQLARKRSHRSKDKLVKRSESSNALEEIASSGDLVTLSAAAAAEAAAAEAAVAAAATTAASATSISQPTQDFKDHPTIRTYQNEYSNWRRGAPRGSSGELTNDRLSGLTVGGEESLLDAQYRTDEPMPALPEALDRSDSASSAIASSEVNSSHYSGAPPATAWDGVKTTDDSAFDFGPLPVLKSTGPSMEIAEIPPYVPKEEDKAWLELEGEEVGSTLTQTVFNGVNAFAGMTQFVLPSIMADVGWIFVPLTIAICATSLYTISLLEACQIRTGAVSFPDVAEAAFGPMGRWLAGILAYVDLFALVLGCMILAARSLELVFAAFNADDDTGNGGLSTSSSMLLVALAFLPTCFLQDLSLVSFLSMGGLIATLFTASLVFRKATDDLNDDINSALPDPHHLGGKRHLLEDIGQNLFGALMARAETQTEPVGPKPFLPLSLLLYQFTLHSLFPSLRASMAKPQEAQRMAALVLSILAGTTIIFAAICYITFGPGMPEQVTTELGTGTIGLLANCLIIWSSYTKFPLGLFPVCDALLELLPTNSKETTQTPSSNKTPPGTPRQAASKKGRDAHGSGGSSQLQHSAWRVQLARCFAVGFTLLVALSFPGFSAVIGFCSWIFAPSLMVAIPIACYLRLFPEVGSINPVRRSLHQAAVICSIAASVIGMTLPLLNAFQSES